MVKNVRIALLGFIIAPLGNDSVESCLATIRLLDCVNNHGRPTFSSLIKEVGTDDLTVPLSDNPSVALNGPVIGFITADAIPASKRDPLCPTFSTITPVRMRILSLGRDNPAGDDSCIGVR